MSYATEKEQANQFHDMFVLRRPRFPNLYNSDVNHRIDNNLTIAKTITPNEPRLHRLQKAQE